MVARWDIFCAFSVVSLATLASPRPIMVTFGTNPGPIVPRRPEVDRAQDRSHVVVPTREPAPVSEEPDDVPNPFVYRAPPPDEYRKRVLSVRPNFGQWRQWFRADEKDGYSRNPGPQYTGPQLFARHRDQTPVRYTRPVLVQQVRKKYRDEGTADAKYVPEIGIFHSSGVKYYVPYYYQKRDKSNAIDENSVYDSQDEKYY